MHVVRFCKFGLKTTIHAPKLFCFGCCSYDRLICRQNADDINSKKLSYYFAVDVQCMS